MWDEYSHDRKAIDVFINLEEVDPMYQDIKRLLEKSSERVDAEQIREIKKSGPKSRHMSADETEEFLVCILNQPDPLCSDSNWIDMTDHTLQIELPPLEASKLNELKD